MIRMGVQELQWEHGDQHIVIRESDWSHETHAPEGFSAYDMDGRKHKEKLGRDRCSGASTQTTWTSAWKVSQKEKSSGPMACRG